MDQITDYVPPASLQREKLSGNAQSNYANDIYSFIPLLKEQIAVSDALDPADKTELLSQIGCLCDCIRCAGGVG